MGTYKKRKEEQGNPKGAFNVIGHASEDKTFSFYLMAEVGILNLTRPFQLF